MTIGVVNQLTNGKAFKFLSEFHGGHLINTLALGLNALCMKNRLSCCLG